MSSPKVFNTLQARHDNATPYSPSKREEAYERLTDSLSEIAELLLKVERKVNELYSLCGNRYCEEELPYLTFQLDTDTARNEIANYLNKEDV